MSKNVQLLTTALSYASVSEFSGTAAHPDILRMFETAGHSWVNNDETPWCSAAMCQWVTECGGQMPARHRLRARSWLTLGIDDGYGVITNVHDLQPGDISIFWRNGPTSIYGHVTLHCDEAERWMHCLGGNQSNRVRIKPYPSYRWLEARRLL
jgi:uncharacterized protein (TIGR02594 family)